MIVGANLRLENTKSPAAMLQEYNLDATCMSVSRMHLVSCCTSDVYILYVSKLVATYRAL